MKKFKIKWGEYIVLILAAVGIGSTVAKDISTRYELPAKIDLYPSTNQADRFKPISQAARMISSIDSITPLRSTTKSKSIDDITGSFIHFYRTALSNGVDGGGKVNITKSSSVANEIIISGFYAPNTPPIQLRATYDEMSQTISIPSQTIINATESTYGVDFTAITSELKPNRAIVFESKIDDNGNFGFNGLWGLVINGGIYANQPIGVYQSLFFAHPNGNLTCKVPNGSSTATISEPVFIWTCDENDIMVENFFNNAGLPVRIKLNHDHTSTIKSQLALINSYGRCYTGAGEFSGSNLTAYSKTIFTDPASSDNEIKWSNWILTITTDEKMQYVGPITETTLRIDNGIFNYPSVKTSSFDGAGTEQSPYIIKSTDDMRLLSYLVSESVDDDAAYTKAFTDKHFRLECDLDFTDIDINPIGNSTTSFNGHFNGDNHTITGLKITKTGRNYIGLFGHADSMSVISNLTLKDCTIASDGIYVGTICGMSNGLIENCHTVNPRLITTAYGAGGIAGTAYDIKGCSVENGQLISQQGYIGGITAETGGNISDCHATEMAIASAGRTVDNSAPAGGIVGFLNEGNITDSHFSGLITNNSTIFPLSIGGIAGQVRNGSIVRCFAAGHLAGGASDSKSNTGGVAGVMSGTMNDCYFAGRIDAPTSTHTGGITGYILNDSENGTRISCCYTSASVNARTFKYDPETEVREIFGTIAPSSNPSVSNVYFDNRITDFGSKTYTAGAATLTSGTLPEGFSEDIWLAVAGQYPRLKKSAETEDARFSATAYEFADNNTLSRIEQSIKINMLGETSARFFKSPDTYSAEGHYGKITDDGTIEFGNVNGTDTLFITNGNRAFYHILAFLPHSYEGDGSEEHPFLLRTKEQLINLSEATTANGQKYAGVHFRITDDIDMEYDSRFKGIASSASANSFDGIIDGDGHTIHNLYLNAIVWTTRPEESDNGLGTANTGKCLNPFGFIGRLGATGILRNLNIANDADISLWSNGGAFVGENNGLVENCRNYSDINTYFSWVGGIVGNNATKGRIIGCFNSGDIHGGNMQTGGITGQNCGMIEESMNVGNVELKQISTNTSAASYYAAGGIAGRSYGGEFINVLNTGAVSANKQAGGISGTLASTSASGSTGNNRVVAGVSYGTVYSADIVNVGGIGGQTGTTSTDSRAYYDCQLAPYAANGGADLEGVEGITTARLISGEALSGLDTDVWQFDSGLYPVLKRFATEPKAMAARRLILNIPDGGNTMDLTVNVPIDTSDGVTYTLSKGAESPFSISGGTLRIPDSPKQIATDTITIEADGVHKPIKLIVYPTFPLDGQGTVESPYIISNSSDWNNLAGFTALKNETYDGKYFSITADIDFSESGFTPMSTNKDKPFQGILDGGSHSLKNIEYTAPANQQYTGIFGYIGSGGKVSGITFEGHISSSATYLGGFVGQLSGTLENIVSKATVSGSKANIGGIVALAAEGAEINTCINAGTVESTATSSISGIAAIVAECKADVKLINCGNEGTIQAQKASTIGGIAAIAEAITITGCYNSGTIDIADNANSSKIGGILASAKYTSKGKTYYISGCTNNADITGKGDIAGIVASADNSTPGNVVFDISECINTGDITSKGTAATAGVTAGILGKYTAGSVIMACVNSGNITSNGGKSTGGILGVKANNSTEALPVIIVDCHNRGNINAKGYHVSGIAGGEMCVVTIDACSNTGDIASGQYMAGGIASYTNIKGSEIINCFNTGNITVAQSQAGGILGCSTVQIDITDCWNSGDIISTSTTPGTATSNANNIGGISGKGAGNVAFCFNSGNLTGLTQVGGIVGLPIKNITKISDSYNAGNVNAPADACGGVVGIDTSASGTYWDSQNTVENVYFASDRVNSDLGVTGTPIEYAALLKSDLGKGWICFDDYSLPISDAHKESDAAHVYSAGILLDDNDVYPIVTKAFHVGKPDNVYWTSDGDITFDGNEAYLGETNGEITLTASAGEYAKSIKITVSTVSSIDEIAGDKTVDRIIYINLNGQTVAKPVDNDGNIYIAVVYYTDGTASVFKLKN